MNTCKIKSIKKVQCKEIPVYDIGVPKYKNFVLSNGLVVHNCKPYQYFKSSIYEKRIEMFEDANLFDEIINLERNIETGKVDHPDGGKKDACDAFCGAIFNASTHAEEFAYDYGESSEQLLRLNDNQADLDMQQLTISLEEELKNMGRSRMGILNPPSLSQTTSDYSNYSDIIIL